MFNKEFTQEKLSGVIERITYHNEQNGWSVLKVTSFKDPTRSVSVLIHQAQVFAGATMEFWGYWSHHEKYGEQFKAQRCLEKKPASSAALEKYLGSGLIKGVGPQTAKKIVNHFKNQTLEIFETKIDKLMLVPGIAKKKLKKIKTSWEEHKTVRDVMIFLQGHGISTLFATKIFKTYGDEAIERVSKNPYRLSHDIYGIGFFSADKIALSMGFEKNSLIRIEAGIKHVLSSSRELGHCFLTKEQIIEQVLELLEKTIEIEKIDTILSNLLSSNEIKKRDLTLDENKLQRDLTLDENKPQRDLTLDENKPQRDLTLDENKLQRDLTLDENKPQRDLTLDENKLQRDLTLDENKLQKIECYYSKSLYYDENTTSKRVKEFTKEIQIDDKKVRTWVLTYCKNQNISLSDEQLKAVCKIPSKSFSILTGGPGCGKTTCTKVLAKLLKAMGLRVTLAAPTGRAAQRMSEVIGSGSKTIHRLLEWTPYENSFKYNENNPIKTDFLILDEVSMLDISLASSLLKAVPNTAQILFIGDSDQLPSVGAGSVLSDLLNTKSVSRFRLTKVFRQAQASSIIRFAHEINTGKVPNIKSPIVHKQLFSKGVDCLFIDADEATQEQLKFIRRVNQTLEFLKEDESNESLIKFKEEWGGKLQNREDGEVEIDNSKGMDSSSYDDLKTPILTIPNQFKNIDLVKLMKTQGTLNQLKEVLKKVHPFSTLHYGLTASETLTRLYTKTIPEWFNKKDVELQVLSPQIRGSVGTMNLNKILQQAKNPESPNKKQIRIGDKILREGDRVIQTKNNYELEIFNGDIGHIRSVDTLTLECSVLFQNKEVTLKKENLNQLQLAYAITIHKSQGSEFEAVIIPVLGQHFNMLFRNLIYTGLTRAKKLALFVGSRKALFMAVKQIDNRKRQTALSYLVDDVI